MAALGVARSSVYYKARPYPERKRTVRKLLAEQIKKNIEEITSKKATYGTPRVRAILKRDYGINLSKYMVHRHMKEEGLLIKRFRSRGSNRAHTGKISVEQPNIRWASDITSIKCWNGQKLRVAFVMDCCDRSIISWKAGLTMQACDIELLVQEAIFQRFADELPPKHQLQFLHDNGPEYIEKNLQKRLKEWNINDCHTPTYSPQSNGMCEALNGTFKRDYVFESCLDDPKKVLSQIQDWVDDYNNFAPHSALKMKTPKEYFIFKIAA
ncbi:IS3 family transposase [Dyadobacter flavalbus]|uniref:IS3 family transposase n=1 Tax=Dyadobacter flavalbus TaxID=2579942 RepID=UPI001E621A32|nr:IS3 family transposase [Dyadobacter flavalbus]